MPSNQIVLKDIVNQKIVIKKIKNYVSENTQYKYRRFDMIYGLYIFRMFQFCVIYIGKTIQILYNFGVDFLESIL